MTQLEKAHPSLFDRDNSDAEPVEERLLKQVSYLWNLFGHLIGENVLDSNIRIRRDINGSIIVDYLNKSLYFWDDGNIEIFDFKSNGSIIGRNSIGNWKNKKYEPL